MENISNVRKHLCIFLIFASNTFLGGSSGETTFNTLCRFEGLCLDCTNGGCEDMCQFYDNNCCVHSSSSKNPLLKKWQYSCVRTFPDMYDLHLDCRASKNGVYGVYMVTKCSDNWTDDFIKSKCEEQAESDLLSRIPVYDNEHEKLTFKNLYCAFCNWLKLQRIRFWKFDLMCDNEILGNGSNLGIKYVPEECFIRLIYREHRMCAVDVIETCAKKERNSTLKDLCENGLSQRVFAWKYGHVFNAYKNEFCAQCNNESDKLQCWAFQAFSCWPQDLPPYRRVKAMISLNLNDKGSKYSIDLYNITCGERVLFDPFSKSCLNITCLQTINVCIPGQCRLFSMDASMISFQNGSSLYFHALDIFISEGRYFVKGSSVHICLDEDQYTKIREMFQSSTQSTVNTSSPRSNDSLVISDMASSSFTVARKSSPVLLTSLLLIFVVKF